MSDWGDPDFRAAHEPRPAPDEWTEPWEATLLVEGEVDPSGRLVAEGALTLPECPFPLTDGQGGIVGRVDEVWRDGNRIMGRGVREGTGVPVGYSVEAAVDRVSTGTNDEAPNVEDATMFGLAAIPLPRAAVDEAEFRARILRGFDLTEDDMAAFEATPQHQSYLIAKAEAEEETRAFVKYVEALGAEVEAKVSAFYNEHGRFPEIEVTATEIKLS